MGLRTIRIDGRKEHGPKCRQPVRLVDFDSGHERSRDYSDQRGSYNESSNLNSGYQIAGHYVDAGTHDNVRQESNRTLQGREV